MVAGIMALPEPAKQMGAPPHWATYFAVDDVQASSDKAAKLGGKTLVPPTAMGPGTFSVVQDPTGAVFLLWNSPQSMGAFVTMETNAFCWAELMTSNTDVARGFYG